MTAIVPDTIKTKKQLKQHLQDGYELILDDPTPFGSDRIVLNGDNPLKGPHLRIHAGDAFKLEPGERIICTNHPKRSWFAQIKIADDWTIKVS